MACTYTYEYIYNDLDFTTYNFYCIGLIYFVEHINLIFCDTGSLFSCEFP